MTPLHPLSDVHGSRQPDHFEAGPNGGPFGKVSLQFMICTCIGPFQGSYWFPLLSSVKISCLEVHLVFTPSKMLQAPTMFPFNSFHQLRQLLFNIYRTRVGNYFCKRASHMLTFQKQAAQPYFHFSHTGQWHKVRATCDYRLHTACGSSFIYLCTRVCSPIVWYETRLSGKRSNTKCCTDINSPKIVDTWLSGDSVVLPHLPLKQMKLCMSELSLGTS